MSKYIDADRLRARIEKYLTYDNNIDTAFYIGRRDAERNILALIDSLQQEQPELPNNERKGIPGRDFIPVDWVEACERYGKWKIVRQDQPPRDYDEAYLNECIAKASKTWKGVDADKYLDEVRGREQEQPEVDLDKEMEEYFKGWTETDEGIACHYQYVDLNTCRGIAHHFYELGLNARKEDEK